MWTKSQLPGSKLIRWGLDSPTSHFACAFFATKDKGLVVHQRFDGFSIDWLPDWQKYYDIVYSLQPKEVDKQKEREILYSIMNSFSSTSYDLPGFMYFSWRAFLYKFFNKPIPKINKWGRKQAPLCTGVAEVIEDIMPQWFSQPVKDFDIVTPEGLFNNMLDSNMFEEATIFSER
jgi:hypothetical protein